MKNYWKNLIRKNLVKHPAYYSKDKLYKKEHKGKFLIPKNIGLTIKTTRKNYILSSKEHIYTPFVKITKTGLEVESTFNKYTKYEILWNKIVEMSFKFTKKS